MQIGFVASAAMRRYAPVLASKHRAERSSPRQEYSEQIVVSEVGAFIPRKLFGQKEQIVNELAQAGVFAPPEPEPPRRGVRRVAPVDIARETQWLQEHRHEYIGQWVALDGDRLISHGTNARAVFEAARAAGVELPFFTRIEPAEEAPFGGW